MATLTSVTNISTKEDSTLTYTFNVLKSLANESSDVTAFRITSISGLGALKAGSGAYVFTESAGVISMNGVAISELWYSTAGVTVIPTSGSNQVITGSFTWKPNDNYFGLANAFAIKGGTVVGATGVNLSTTAVDVKVNVTRVNDAPSGYCSFTSSGSATTPAIGDYLTASSDITDIDGITAGAINYAWERSTDNGATWNVIGGASGTVTYTLTASDIGSSIKVRAKAIYTDKGGTLESFISINTLPPTVGTDLYFKQNNAYVQAKEVYIKLNDVWVKAKEVYIKQNDVWVKV